MEFQYKKILISPVPSKQLTQMSEPSVSALHFFNIILEGRSTMASLRIRYVYASLNIIRVMTGAKGLILYRELVETFGFQCKLFHNCKAAISVDIILPFNYLSI